MAQRKRKRNKKWLFWLVFVVLLAGAAAVCYFVWDGYFRDKKKPEGTSENSVEVVEKKDTDIEKAEDKKAEEDEAVTEKEKVVQYDGDDPNEAQELTGVVTYAGVSGNNLMIRVNIDQYLSGGKCILGLRREGASIYGAEASIVDAASTSTCEGFNVPLSDVSNGHFSIVIFLESGGKTGEIHGEVDL